MKYLAILFTVLFILFASFQLNDPDPVRWVALYIYAAAVSALVATGKVKLYLIGAGLGVVIYIVGMVYFWPDTFDNVTQSMSIMRPEIEQARETGGLSICLVIMIVYLIYGWKRK